MSHFPRNPWGGARLPESTEPAGADPLAEMLETLRRPGLVDELAGEARSVARIAAAVQAAGTVDHHRRVSVASRRFRLSLTAALAGAALTAMSGLAYAGALPDAAQGRRVGRSGQASASRRRLRTTARPQTMAPERRRRTIRLGTPAAPTDTERQHRRGYWRYRRG